MELVVSLLIVIRCLLFVVVIVLVLFVLGVCYLLVLLIVGLFCCVWVCLFRCFVFAVWLVCLFCEFVDLLACYLWWLFDFDCLVYSFVYCAWYCWECWINGLICFVNVCGIWLLVGVRFVYFFVYAIWMFAFDCVWLRCLIGYFSLLLVALKLSRLFCVAAVVFGVDLCLFCCLLLCLLRFCGWICWLNYLLCVWVD